MAQLGLSSGILAFVTQLAAMITLIVLTVQMCDESKTLATDSLTNQIYENTEITAYQTSLIIDRELRILLESITLGLDRGLEFMEEYNVTGHLKNETTLFSDQVHTNADYPQTDRLGDETSSFLTDSIWMVETTYDASTPNVDGTSASGYTYSIINSTSFVDNSTYITDWFSRTSHLTRLMKFSYEQWTSIAAIYIGADFSQFACPTTETACSSYPYQNSQYRIFREYPGDQYGGERLINYPDNPSISIPYDPTLRGWYQEADTTPYDYHLDGPYTDAGSGRWMITFSKKVKETTFTPKSVIGLDLLLTDLQQIVQDIQVGANGFAILLLYPRAAITTCANDGGTCSCDSLVRYVNNYESSPWRFISGDSIECAPSNFDITILSSGGRCECEPDPYVLAYGQDVIDNEIRLSEKDPQLANAFGELRANNIKGDFSYSNQNGKYVGGFGNALDDQMVVVTVAPEDEALAAVSTLDDDISATESTISALVIVLTIVSLFISLGFVYYSSSQISRPLVDITTNCKTIMEAQTKEDKFFTPTPITVFGRDGLYELAEEFVGLMKGMHESESKKQSMPKYPDNQYWVGHENMNAPWRVYPISRFSRNE